MAGVRGALLTAALLVIAPVLAPVLALAQPQSLTLGTASVGGTYHVYGGVVAALLTDKAGLQVTTQQTQGPNQNVIMIEDGKIGLGMTTMGVALQALQGSAPWTKGKKYDSIRALFPMYDTPMQCVSLKKSGIASFRQLDGKTVGTGQSVEMGHQLNDGLIDAFCFGAGAPVPMFTQLDAEQQVAFYTWTPEDIALIRGKMPEFTESTIPRGLYKQQTADQKTIGLYNFAIANKDMPDATAYAITKTVLESNRAMLSAHTAAKETVAANASRNTILTFHPGAVRYYREKGIRLDPATLPK